MPGIKAAVGALALAAGLAGIGVAVAPAQAQADVNSYVFDLENNNLVEFTGYKWQYIDLGRGICRDLAAGWGDRAVINAAYSNPFFAFDYTAAEEVFYLAKENLCPYY